MKFTPETYKIPDIPMQPFIDEDEIWEYLHNTVSTKKRVREVIAKSLSKQRLNLEEVAVLINANDPESIHEIKEAPNSSKKLFTAIASYSSHPYM
jgi:2-iminoacetate synthase